MSKKQKRTVNCSLYTITTRKVKRAFQVLLNLLKKIRAAIDKKV